MKKIEITQRYEPETLEALRFWKQKTGIPFNTLVEQGCVLKIKELEEMYKENHKSK